MPARKASTHRNGSNSGFTLIEVMTAVTILALMAAMTFTVVFGAVKRSRVIDARSELEIEADGILRLIVEDLRGSWEREGQVPFFVGEDRFAGDRPADGVSFHTTAVIPVSPELPTGGIGEVQYLVQENEMGETALYRREQVPAEPPYDDGGSLFEISDRVRSLDISYSDGEDWFSQWDSQGAADHETGRLPRQVRVELTLAYGEEELTVRTSVTPVMAVGR
ncbi:MAG: type II secretion system protein GspJ [bacterium]|nr:type II secretion system protein GspJ [bacterium]